MINALVSIAMDAISFFIAMGIGYYIHEQSDKNADQRTADEISRLRLENKRLVDFINNHMGQ